MHLPSMDFKQRQFTRHSQSVETLWCAACIGVLTLILFWRRPDAFYRPQFWAEDGSRFFSGSFFQGAASIIKPFAGYYHLSARLTAWIGSFLSPLYAPAWYYLASWLLLVFIVAYLFSNRFLFASHERFLLGVFLVGTTVNNEVFFNLANWATLTTIFIILLVISEEPRSRAAQAFDLLLLVLTGLNSPFVICMWPFFGVRNWLRSTQHSLNLFVLSLLCAGIQLWNMSDRAVKGGILPEFNHQFVDFIVYHFGFLFLGEPLAVLPFTNGIRFIGCIIILVFYIALFKTAWLKQNWAQLTLLGSGIAATSLSLFVVRHDLQFFIQDAGRHYYLSALTLAWALTISVDKWKWIPVALILNAFLFLTPTSKGQILPDLDWRGEVANCVGTQPLCRIPINPVWEPPVWFAAMNSRQFDVPPLQTQFIALFDQQIELLGYNIHQTESELTLELAWRAMNTSRSDYKFFVHLNSQDNPTLLFAQADGMPLNWSYPTSLWMKDEVVLDKVSLLLSSVPEGTYEIGVGWYDPQSPNLLRLHALNAQGEPWDENRVVLPLKIEIPLK